MILISVDPMREDHFDADGNCIAPCVQDWPELGRTGLGPGSDRSAVLSEIDRWIEAPKPDAIAMCFYPRHAVIVRSKRVSFEFLICFDRDRMEVRRVGSDKLLRAYYLTSSPDPFDGILSRHRVPLAAPDEDRLRGRIR